MREKLSWWFNSIPFRKKTALLLVLVIIVSMLVFSLLIRAYVSSVLVDRTIEQLDNTLFKMDDNLSQLTTEIVRLSDGLKENELVQEYIYAEFEDLEESRMMAEEISRSFSLTTLANEAVSSIYIVRPDAVSLRVGDVFDYSWAAIRLTNYYKLAQENPDGLWMYDQFLTYHLTTKNEKVISFLYPYFDEGGQMAALQFINVKDSALSRALEPKDHTIGSSFAVMDLQGNHIAYTNSSFLDTFTAKLPYVDKVLAGDSGFRFVLEDQEYLINAVYSETCQWFLISFTNMDYVNEPLGNLNLMLWACAAMIIGLAMLTSVALADLICKSLTNLASKMDNVKQGKMYDRAVINGMDEVNVLSIHFNDMMDRLENTVDQLAAEKNLKMKTELNALQEQINPHFLYNLLETINYKAKQNHDYTLSETIIALADFLRLSVNKGKNYLRLSDEIRCVQNYIYLQNVRYENRFRVYYDIAPETERAMVLKLCMQPLVENAILHGFDDATKINEIYIKTRLSGEELYIEIHDNGAGISPQRLVQINRVLSGGSYPSMNVYGIYNVNRRIKLYYGDEFGLHMESEEGKYTTAVLRMRYLEEVADV